jgi:hypothetical protein
MRNLAAKADRIDYWMPAPHSLSTHVRVDPALLRLVGLTAIGQALKDHYKAITTPMPAHLAALVEQLETQRR